MYIIMDISLMAKCEKLVKRLRKLKVVDECIQVLFFGAF